MNAKAVFPGEQSCDLRLVYHHCSIFWKLQIQFLESDKHKVSGQYHIPAPENKDKADRGRKLEKLVFGIFIEKVLAFKAFV